MIQENTWPCFRISFKINHAATPDDSPRNLINYLRGVAPHIYNHLYRANSGILPRPLCFEFISLIQAPREFKKIVS